MEAMQVEECFSSEITKVPSFIATTIEEEEEHTFSASSSHIIDYEKY